MSDEQLIPNAVGRLDDVVEAIRVGDRGLAENLLHEEFKRQAGICQRMANELEKRQKALSELTDFSEDIAINSGKWTEARKACGWPGVDGVEGPVETLPHVKPAPDGEPDYDLIDELQDYTAPSFEVIGTRTCGPMKPVGEPTLKAEDLPIGAVMVLGGNKYRLDGGTSCIRQFIAVIGGNKIVLLLCEIQELIDRGVRFEMQKGGA